MKTIHFPVVFAFIFFSTISLLSSQSCSEQALSWLQITGFYLPLPDSVFKCVEAETRRPIPSGDEQARYACIKGLIALGNDYGYKKKNYIALQRLLRAESLLQDGKRPDSLYRALTYNLLGFYYKEFFQFDLAEQYNFRSLQLSERLGNRQGVLEQLINLTEVYTHTGKHEKAKSATRQVSDLLNSLSGRMTEKMRKATEIYARSNLAYTYIDKGRKQKLDFDHQGAEAAYDTAISIFKRMLPDVRKYVPEREASCYENIGVLFTRKTALAENTDSAILYLEKYLAIPPNDQVEYLNDAHRGYVFCTIGGALARIGRFDEGLRKNAGGLALLGYRPAHALDFPDIPQNVQFPEAQFLLNGLMIRGEILYGQYKSGKDPNYLRAADNALDRATAIANRLAASQISDQSVFAYRTLFQMLYTTAAAYSAELYQLSGNETDLSRSFDYAEQSRATVLRHHLHTAYNSALRSDRGGWEFAFREKEDYYRGKVLEYQQKGLTDSLAMITAQFGRFIDTLRRSADTSAQQYYHNRFNRATTSLATLRRDLLDDTTAFIGYVWTYPKPVMHVATKNSVQVESLDLDASFFDHCKNLIATGLETESDNSFRQSGKYLYDKLLKNVLEKPDMRGIKRLVVVQDNVLREIPFEALLTGPPKGNDTGKYPWLVYKYVVDYQYSVSVWQSLKERSERLRKQSGATDKFAAFVARYPAKDGRIAGCDVGDLPHLRRSAESDIPQKFSESRVFVPARASDFTVHAKSFDVLHFAMHGCPSDPDSPLDYALLFSTDSLTIADIYRQRLKAKLVVFGSCNTESGQNKAGEGIIGIARAFSFAGCPNLLATLHQVPDQATAQLLILLYDNLLRKQMPTDVALATAKRQFLARTDIMVEKHPHYWANLICIGPPQLLR